MRVLVTGGAGFIGANFVQHLSARGSYHIVVLDDLSAGQKCPCFPPGVRFVRGDFTDKAAVMECLDDVDAVVHLAALSGVVDSVEDARPSFKVNVVGSFQMLELARAAKIRRFIFASTGGAILGEASPPISEAMAPSPLSPYGASKLAMEGYLSAFASAYALPCIVLRFSNIYGPRSSHKKSVVAAFIKNIIREEPLIVYGDGTQKRDYLYVDDLVSGVEAALKGGRSGVYQLGSGRPTALHTLIGMLGKISGRDLQIRYDARRDGEVHSTWCDISKATREFGYNAPTDIANGLSATWTWYLANRETWSRQVALSASD
jgi:UDP-glucose 4-epimerase